MATAEGSSSNVSGEGGSSENKTSKVKCRFAAGRIKKILQADDEVGRVSQGTPVVISQATELFIEALMNGVVAEAKKMGAKTLQPFHLKRCVEFNKQFDYLKDIVASVKEMKEQNKGISEQKPNAKRKRKQSTASDEEEGGAGEATEEPKSTSTSNGNKERSSEKKSKCAIGDAEDDFLGEFADPFGGDTAGDNTQPAGNIKNMDDDDELDFGLDDESTGGGGGGGVGIGGVGSGDGAAELDDFISNLDDDLDDAPNDINGSGSGDRGGGRLFVGLEASTSTGPDQKDSDDDDDYD